MAMPTTRINVTNIAIKINNFILKLTKCITRQWGCDQLRVFSKFIYCFLSISSIS